MAKANSKVKARGANINVPQDRAGVNSSIAEIGNLNREVQRLETSMNDALARTKERFEKKAEPLRSKQENLVEGVRIYCEANRDDLTGDRKVKFCKFPAGEISWRMRPAKVTLRGKDAIIGALRAARLNRFLRITEDVNKEAIRNEPEAVEHIKGLSVGSEGEDFNIEPFEVELNDE